MRRRSGTSMVEQFAQMRGDYDASRAHNNKFLRARLVGLSSTGTDADYHIRHDRYFLNMVELARELERNEPLLRQGVRRLTANVNVGGMKVDPDTGNEDIDEHLTRKWNAWGSDKDRCDHQRKNDFATMANIAFTRMVIDGDIFGVFRSSGRLQMLEAHRCRTPNRAKKDRGVCGVVTNDAGEPLSYRFTRRQRNGLHPVKVEDMETVAARNSKGFRQVVHVYRPERASATRGITSFAPCLGVTAMRDDLDFSVLVKSQTNSCVTITESWELGAETAYKNSRGGLGEKVDERVSPTTGQEQRQAQLAPGAILESKGPGHKYEMFSPNVPNQEYFMLSKLLLTYLSVNLDLPLIIFLLDAKDANYSSYRNVLEQSRMTFTEFRRFFASQFHREVYLWKVREWMTTDPVLRELREQEVAAGITDVRDSALFKHQWNHPRFEYIDPVKDATRYVIERANGQMTDREFHAMRGSDWKQHDRQIARERAFKIRLAITEAQAIKAETGVEVDWKLLMPLPNADYLRVNIVDGPSNAEEQSDDPVVGSNNGTNGHAQNRLEGLAV